MVCGLSDEALFILNYLYHNRNLAPNKGQNSKKMAKIFNKRYGYDNKYFKKTVKLLENAGYIAQIKKRDIKYYISDKPITFYALGEHGYNVSPGRERPL